MVYCPQPAGAACCAVPQNGLSVEGNAPESGGGLFRADGIDKKAGAQLKSGRRAGSWTYFNVPVKAGCKIKHVFHMGYRVKEVIVLHLSQNFFNTCHGSS